MLEEEKLATINPHKPCLVDVGKVAEVLGVPKSWIYERTRKGTIPMHRIGKYVRFNLDDVLEWAKASCPTRWK